MALVMEQSPRHLEIVSLKLSRMPGYRISEAQTAPGMVSAPVSIRRAGWNAIAQSTLQESGTSESCSRAPNSVVATAGFRSACQGSLGLICGSYRLSTTSTTTGAASNHPTISATIETRSLNDPGSGVVATSPRNE